MLSLCAVKLTSISVTTMFVFLAASVEPFDIFIQHKETQLTGADPIEGHGLGGGNEEAQVEVKVAGKGRMRVLPPI